MGQTTKAETAPKRMHAVTFRGGGQGGNGVSFQNGATVTFANGTPGGPRTLNVNGLGKKRIKGLPGGQLANPYLPAAYVENLKAHTREMKKALKAAVKKAKAKTAIRKATKKPGKKLKR